MRIRMAKKLWAINESCLTSAEGPQKVVQLIHESNHIPTYYGISMKPWRNKGYSTENRIIYFSWKIYNLEKMRKR